VRLSAVEVIWKEIQRKKERGKREIVSILLGPVNRNVGMYVGACPLRCGSRKVELAV
jgi:hypothetical protein